MHGTSRYTVAPGIVLRLRIVFLSVAVILAGAMLLGQGQIRQLDRSVAWLTVNSITAFIEATETERGLKNLLLLLQSVDSARHTEDLAILSERVKAQLQMLRAGKAERLVKAPLLSQTRQMIAALDEIEAGTESILSAKSAILRHTENIARLNTVLITANDLTRAFLENLTYETSSSQDLFREQIPKEALVSPILVEQSFTKRLLEANAITAISLDLEAAIGTARGLGNVNDQSELTKLEASLRQKLRSITVLLGQLKDSPFRIGLATEIIKLRDLILEEDGLVNEVERLLESQEILEASILTQIRPIGQISELSGHLTENALKQVVHSQSTLSITTERMITILSLWNAPSEVVHPLGYDYPVFRRTRVWLESERSPKISC